MGVYVIKMPDIGEGIAEVELVEWHVKEGDAVVEDQVLADVMTDKATVQVPSPVTGTVLSLGGSVGEVMAVGSDLIQLQVGDQAPENGVRPQSENGVRPQFTGEPATSAAQSSEDDAASSAPATHQNAATEAAALPIAAAAPIADVDSPAQPTVPRPRPTAGGRPLASPAVRRRAQNEGVDLRVVPATGPVGQITHEDLD